MPNKQSRPLTTAEYEKLVSAGNENAAIDPKLKQQVLMAEYLRKGNAPQGRQAGAVYVAPHWLELAGGLAREWAAGKQARAGQDSAGSQATNKALQKDILLRAMLGQQSLYGQPEAAPVEPAGQGFDPTRQPGGPF